MRFILQHKIIIGLIALALIGSGYYGYKHFSNNESAARYIFAQAQKGALIVSVSGSGQVSAASQVDIKSKVSGDVLYVGVKNGQEIKTGVLIAQIDARDAQKTVRDANVSLESAELSLEKLKKPADALSILQAENALAQSKESKQKAEQDLIKAYDDGFNTVANGFLDLPTIMSGLEDMFFDNTIDKNQDNITWYVNQTSSQDTERNKAIRYRNDVETAYNNTRVAYTKNFDHYKSASRASDTQTIEALILETYETTKIAADTVKTSNNYIDFVQDSMEQRDLTIASVVSTHQSSLDSYTGTTNSHLLNLFSIKRTIQTSKEAIVNASRSIAEKTESLAKLKAGADALDIQSSELSIKQKKNALLDAKEKLADYFIRAPFDGVIAEANVKKGDAVSSASVFATVIARQKLAEISLNEVDVAKVKIGQKTTLTFDAVPELTITGQVAEVGSIGVVSQGVVTYGVKIAFDPVRGKTPEASADMPSAYRTSNGVDAQDERIKPGMSVSAAIITDSKIDVLLVPNSAVKQQNGISYVEVMKDGAPEQRIVETGLANDTLTEIISGLDKGEQVITQTITSATKTAQTQSQGAGIRIPGMGGFSPR